MSSIIYVGFDKSLTIPKKFNIEIFGKEEPTPDCFTINIGKKRIRLSLSGEYPYNEIYNEDSDSDEPTYLTYWIKYEIVIPSYYMEMIDAKEGDAYEVEVGTSTTDTGGEYRTIILTKQT